MLEIVGVVMAALTTVGLAWVAAWQQRAAKEVRKLNGTVEIAVQEVAARVADVGPKLETLTEVITPTLLAAPLRTVPNVRSDSDL